MTIFEAASAPAESVSISDIKNRTAADYIYAFPPDIPIVVPGELIDDKMADRINELIKDGVELMGIHEGRFKVLKEA